MKSEEGMPVLSRRRILLGVAAGVCLMCFAAAWRWTPLRETISPDTFKWFAREVRSIPYAPWIFLGCYLAGGVVMFPVTVLIFATAFVFDTGSALLYGLAGCTLNALPGYALGHVFGHDLVVRLTGPRMDRFSRRLADHGVLAVLTVRIVPVAPFSVISILAGASRIRLCPFIFGTLLGMLPGVTMIALFERQLEKAVFSPSSWHLAGLAFILAVMVSGAALVRRWLNAGGKG